MKRVVLPNQEDGAQSPSPTPTPPAPSAEKAPIERTVSRQKQSLPPELVEILVPSLKVGAAAGMILDQAT
jgi:hypothetical protein